MRANLATREPEWLAFWDEIDIYRAVARGARGRRAVHPARRPARTPTATSTWAPRTTRCSRTSSSSTSRCAGYYAPYVPGWDCHGQPIEHQVEKKLGPEKMAKISQAKLRELCRDWAMEFVDVQREEFKRLGVRGDWDDPYLTLNHSYEAGDVKVFAELYERGEIYKGRKPIHWCKRCHTALAEAEIEYSDEQSDSIYVKFRFTDEVAAVLVGGAARQRADLDDDAVDAAGQRRRHARRRRRLRGRAGRRRGARVRRGARASRRRGRRAGRASRSWSAPTASRCASRAATSRALHYAQPIHDGVRGVIITGEHVELSTGTGRGAHRARARRGRLPRRHEVRPADADAGRRQRRVRRRAADRSRACPSTRRIRSSSSGCASAARCWRPARSATATRTAGAASSRSSSARPTSGSSRWTRPHLREAAHARDRPRRVDPGLVDQPHGSAWSATVPTGASAASARGACRSRCSSA